jgi:PAS domain S-box-containing protein
MKFLDQWIMKKYDSLRVILFFVALTIVVTALVVLVWEKVFMHPFYAWIADYRGGGEGHYYFQQRIEHFLISTTVDVLIVTLLLHIVSRQQSRLVASEKRYRALFEHASDGIGIVTADDHRLVEVNNKFCDILGCQPKDLIGNDICDLLSADNGGNGNSLSRVLGGTGDETEMMIRLRDGDSVAAAVSSSKLKTDGENLVILIIQDLSERRRLESEKEQIRRQLLQSSKLASIGELSAGVAHEINNPLNGIINFAQLLKDDAVARTDEQRRMVDGIIDEGERIARIVRDLLTFARQDPHELSHVNVADAIEASLSLFGHQLKKDGITVELDVEDNLPPVMADCARLRQVMVNMVSNAHQALRSKSTGEKVYRMSVHVAGSAGDKRVRIECYDTGVGIPARDIDKVFDPFFTTRRCTGGTGLGLSISFGIIRQYGGTITVESVEGVFTRFIVELPAAVTREDTHARTQSAVGGR